LKTVDLRNKAEAREKHAEFVADRFVSFFLRNGRGVPKETFSQITKRVVPKGFGTGKAADTLKKEARRNFDLARLK
jgi:hypothetical protein